LKRYGYSPNDIDLIHGWFFVDPRLANPQTLQAMVSALGPLPAQGNALSNASLGVQTLWHPTLLPLFVPAVVLLVLGLSWRVMAVWIICIVLVAVLGAMGRPGIVRVYVPLLSLLLLAPLLADRASGLYRIAGVYALVIAAMTSMVEVAAESRALHETDGQIRAEMIDIPASPVVVWGAGFPFEATYPVLQTSPIMAARFYGLNAFTLAPFSVAFAEQKAGRGFIDMLLREKGIPIIGADKLFKDNLFGYLTTYCREHHGGNLRELGRMERAGIVVSGWRCEAER
jgi:hypothetical protein